MKQSHKITLAKVHSKLNELIHRVAYNSEINNEQFMSELYDLINLQDQQLLDTLAYYYAQLTYDYILDEEYEECIVIRSFITMMPFIKEEYNEYLSDFVVNSTK